MNAINGYQLDSSAVDLYRQLEGLDQKSRVLPKNLSMAVYTKMERRRLVLLHFARLISDYLTNNVSWTHESKKQKFTHIAKTLLKIYQMHNQEKSLSLLIRRNSYFLASFPCENYMISSGTTKVDVKLALSLFSTPGIDPNEKMAPVIQSFQDLTKLGIETLLIRNFGKTLSDRNQLYQAFEILSAYLTSVQRNAPVSYNKDGKQKRIQIICDERGYPDPNLTLVAELNRISPAPMNGLIKKVARFMGSKRVASRLSAINVYHAMFQIKGIKDKLTRPPLEVNNPHLLFMDSNPDSPPNEKIHLARLAFANSGGSPEKETEILDSIYGNDFDRIDTLHLGKRLQMASELLNAVENQSDSLTLEDELLLNFETRVELVQDEIIDDILIQGNKIQINQGQQQPFIATVHAKITEMLHLLKHRSEAKRKLRQMIHQPIDFSRQDYHALARDFDIPVEDAEDLVTLLGNCFDEQGRFLRTVFEANVPIFAWYENKVFDLMWYFLKETPRRNDRVAFLNALQLLISHLKQPAKAIEVLLMDFLKDPQTINFSDRNAMMLANILLRTYHLEMNMDIEITPEEVLRVRKGLDVPTCAYALKLVEENRNDIFEKFRIIHNQIINALNPQPNDAPLFPLKFLLALEREFFIFLSLVEGSTGHSVIRSAILQYGNPESEIYTQSGSRKALVHFMQHLKVLVRCLERFRDIRDYELLNNTLKWQRGFLSLGTHLAYRDKAQQVFKWIQLTADRLADMAPA